MAQTLHGIALLILESSCVSTPSLSAISARAMPITRIFPPQFPTPGIANRSQPKTGIRRPSKISVTNSQRPASNSFYFIALFQRFRTIP
jgi:hypothetical protein